MRMILRVAVMLAAFALSAWDSEPGFETMKQYAPGYADGVAWLDLSKEWSESAFATAVRCELGIPVQPCKVMAFFKSGDDWNMALAVVMTENAAGIDDLAECFKRTAGAMPAERITYQEREALLVDDEYIVSPLAAGVFMVGRKESLDRYFSTSARGMGEELYKRAEPYLELPCFGTLKMAEDDHNYMLRADFSVGIDGDYLAAQGRFTMFDDLAAKRYCEELRMIWPARAREAARGDRDLRRTMPDAATFNWKNDIIRARAVLTSDMFSAILRQQIRNDEYDGKVR
ncbi:MAG: hypothetical protein AB7F40_05390 [Victivallaceae bacterium]|nr:hypothetical protein [Victivallaceae bacterium]